MARITQNLQFVAMKPVPSIRQHVKERDRPRNRQQGPDVACERRYCLSHVPSACPKLIDVI